MQDDLWLEDNMDEDPGDNRFESHSAEGRNSIRCSDAASIVCDCQTSAHQFSRQVLIDQIKELSQAEFDNMCIGLIQNQHFHETIMNCAGTEEEQYIPENLKKNFVIKKVVRDHVPLLKETVQNPNSASTIAQKSKTSSGYCKEYFINAIKAMNDGEFQTVCSDIKGNAWEADALSNHLHTNKPFLIPPKLRSNFWVTGIDNEHFFVYDPFSKHPDEKIFWDNMRDVNSLITAVRNLSQTEFDSLCRNFILSQLFVYDVSGMAGTDLPERIPEDLKQHFSQWECPIDTPDLDEQHSGGWLIGSNPGFVIQGCKVENSFSKRQFTSKLLEMNKRQFEDFAFEASLVIGCKFSYQDYLFTSVFNDIPKELRMYFRYFDIRDDAFTQRLDRYFGDSSLNYRVFF